MLETTVTISNFDSMTDLELSNGVMQLHGDSVTLVSKRANELNERDEITFVDNASGEILSRFLDTYAGEVTIRTSDAGNEAVVSFTIKDVNVQLSGNGGRPAVTQEIVVEAPAQEAAAPAAPAPEAVPAPATPAVPTTPVVEQEVQREEATATEQLTETQPQQAVNQPAEPVETAAAEEEEESRTHGGDTPAEPIMGDREEPAAAVAEQTETEEKAYQPYFYF